jgi:hypothetical protein
MKRITTALLFIAVLATLLEAAYAQQDESTQWVTTSRPRYEIAIGGHSWPGLADIRPVRDGSFDEAGFNISLSGHWPVKRFARSELLVGGDLGFFSNESSIPFITEDVTARTGYLGPSLKWMFGSNHRYSLDAGLGYYLLDIAEVAGEYPGIFETQLWEDEAIGGYVGGTIDFGGGRPGKSRGFMLSMKVHIVEFEQVRDETPFFPATLGQDAGDIAGPVYMFQVGYRTR